MSGYVAISRELFDHPFFAPDAYSEREAWTWMIAAAVWRPTKVRVGRKIFNLKRGQLVFAERFLAKKWGWTKSKVRRFLQRLSRNNDESGPMVNLSADREATLITICNYDKYQSSRTAGEPQNEPQSGPPADHRRTKEEPLNHRTKEHDDGVRAVANEIADEIGRLCGHPTPHDWPPSFLGAPARIEAWLRNGWPRDAIIGGVKETLARKRDGPPENVTYFERPIAKFIARNSAPLPKYEAQNGSNAADNSVVSHARRLAERARDFDRKPPDLRSGEGGADVRLLSKG